MSKLQMHEMGKAAALPQEREQQVSAAANNLRPLFLIKPGTMSRKDIARAEKLCGICIVECDKADEARFCEAPITANLDDQSRAALSLMRIILRNEGPTFHRGDLMKWFVQELLAWDNVPAKVQQVKSK